MASWKLMLVAAFVLALWLAPSGVESRPMSGKFSDVIYSYNASEAGKINGTCHMVGMYNGTTISIDGLLTKEGVLTKEQVKASVDLNLVVKVFKLRCATYLQAEDSNPPCNRNANLESSEAKLKAVAVLPIRGFNIKSRNLKVHANMTTYKNGTAPLKVQQLTTPPDNGETKKTEDDTKPDTTKPDTTKPDTTKPDTTKPYTTKPDTPAASTTKRSAKDHNITKDNGNNNENDASTKSMKEDIAITIGTVVDPEANRTKESGVYLVQVYVERLGDSKETTQLTAQVNVAVHNPHGYLSAVDYPALVFFGIMTSVYAIFGIAWIIMMLCSFNDLVRLQFWVLAVIILGFIEKTLFVAEYSAINLGSDTYGTYFIAEFFSAVKRGVSRMLLIIVAMGFGTVKPRLGDSLVKVVGVGVAFIVLAFIDGIMRAKSETFHVRDTSSVVTLALLLLLDTFIFYWIFTAIVDTRRTLRLRKNYVKLAMYNHFAYVLVFSIIATIGFLIWVFVDLEYPLDMCLTDWREVWLRDCFWHVLFAFILVWVMVIWRPSSNRSRFAYSLVTDQDDDEVLFEQGNNKNFDTVKMRSVSKSDAPPPVTSQAEDDLRWVEENLPTTAMDKALPLLLDSDEEVMTTKFEMSKMN